MSEPIQTTFAHIRAMAGYSHQILADMCLLCTIINALETDTFLTADQAELPKLLRAGATELKNLADTIEAYRLISWVEKR